MIYVECKPDVTLVKTITKISNKEVIHAGNKPEVCKQLRNQTNCVGLVDEDPGSSKPCSMSEMRLEKEIDEINVKIFSDKNRNRLIVLCPKLEEWVLGCVKETKIEIEKYNLPNNAKKLHEVININLKSFKDLINDLLKHSHRLKMLKDLLIGKEEK